MKTTQLEVASGETLAVHAAGESGRPVVLVHGNSMCAEAFGPLLRGSLVHARRLYAIDLPGHGAAAPARDPSAAYTLRGYREAVRGVLEALDLEGAVLVGHSLGGHVALECLDSPRVGGAFAVGAPPLESAASFASAFLAAEGMELLFTETVSPEEARVAAALATNARREAVAEWILATHGLARSTLWASFAAGEVLDEHALIRGAGKPVALALGADDPLVNRDYVMGLALPLGSLGARLFDGCGHSPQLDDPEAFEALLGEFLDEVDAAEL